MPSRRTAWSLYMVRCADGTLYTGIATDVARRLEEHAAGGGRSARYLRGRGPLELVLEHRVGSRGLALRVEARVKRLAKARKEELACRGDLVRRLVRSCGRKAPHDGGAPPEEPGGPGRGDRRSRS